MAINQSYKMKLWSSGRIPETVTGGKCQRKQIPDNRPSAILQKKLIDHIVIQRETDIEYTTQNLTIAGKTCVVGKSMKACLDPNDKVLGSATSGGQKDIMEQLKGYVRGHLLNHDLGGLGIASNLFPITPTENGEHKNKAEKYVKNSLGKNNKVYYCVEAQNDKTNYANADNFKAEHPGFKWGASNVSYPKILGRDSLDFLDHKLGENPWEHDGRQGLPKGDDTTNTLSKTKIDGIKYTYEQLTDVNKSLKNG